MSDKEDSPSEEQEEGESGSEHHDQQRSRDDSIHTKSHRFAEGEGNNIVRRTRQYKNYHHDLSISTATESSRTSRASTMDSEIHGPAATAERRYSQNNLDKTKKGNQASGASPVINQPQNNSNSRPSSGNRTLSPFNRDSLPLGEQQKLTENRKNNALSRSPYPTTTPRSTPSPKSKKDERHSNTNRHSRRSPSRSLSTSRPPCDGHVDEGRTGAAVDHGINHVEEEPEEDDQQNVQQIIEMHRCVRCCRRFRFSLLILTILILICGVIFIPTWVLHISGPTEDKYIYTSLRDYVRLDTHLLTAEGVSLSTEVKEPRQGIKNSGTTITLRHGSCEESWGYPPKGHSQSSRTAYNETHYFSQHVFNFGKTTNLNISVNAMIFDAASYEVCFYLFKDYSDLTDFIKNPPTVHSECGSKDLLTTSETVQCSFSIVVQPSTKRGNCTFGYSGNKYSVTPYPEAPCRNETFTGHHYLTTKIVTANFAGPLNVSFDFVFSTTSTLQKNSTLTRPAGVCKKQTDSNFTFLCILKYGNLFSLTKGKPCTFATIETSLFELWDIHSSVLQLTVSETKRKDVIGYSVVVMALPVFIVVGAYLYWVPIRLTRKIKDCIVNTVRSQRTRRLHQMLT